MRATPSCHCVGLVEMHEGVVLQVATASKENEEDHAVVMGVVEGRGRRGRSVAREADNRV